MKKIKNLEIKLANKMIKELEKAGFTHNEMIRVFKMARIKLKEYENKNL